MPWILIPMEAALYETDGFLRQLVMENRHKDKRQEPVYAVNGFLALSDTDATSGGELLIVVFVCMLTDLSSGLSIMSCPQRYPKPIVNEDGEDESDSEQEGDDVNFEDEWRATNPRKPNLGIFPEDFPFTELTVPVYLRAGQVCLWGTSTPYKFKSGDKNVYG